MGTSSKDFRQMTYQEAYQEFLRSRIRAGEIFPADHASIFLAGWKAALKNVENVTDENRQSL